MELNRWAWASLAVVVLVGSTVLAVPYYGDQALFAVIGKSMTSGEVLYVDWWDPKQPATFVFYAVGGSLFGFGEVGIHLFELAYWLGFSVVILVVMRTTYRHPATPAGVVLLGVGTYYLSVRQSWLGQTEGLVAFPLFLSMWFIHAPSSPRTGPASRLFLAGVFTGIVLLFKLVFAPIVIAFWALAIRRAARSPDAALSPHATAGWLLLGGLAPMVATVAYLLANGALDEFLWASFRYPLEALAVPDALKSPSFLVRSAGSFVLSYTLTGTLALLGLWRSRRASAPGREIVWLSVLWLAAGSVVILAQRTAWWSYHFLLLFAPLAVLAGFGLDYVIDWWRSATVPRQLVAVVAAGGLLVPGASNLFDRTVPLLANGVAITEADRSAYRAEMDGDYALRAGFGAFLDEPGAPPGPVYVYGNPLYLYFSERPTASAVHGWSTQFWSDQLWDDVLDDINREQPPFVLMAREERVQARHPETLAFLRERYVVLKSDPELGTWYLMPPG